MSYETERNRLLQLLERRGIHDPRVLEALREIPREAFISPAQQADAYADCALPIAGGQTISQPYMVALMTQELSLRGGERVLEIGTGSGYQTAILSRLCRQVVTLERLPELAAPAGEILQRLGIANVEQHVGDGSLGWPAGAPYDGILVTAGAPEVPPELYRQLKLNGRLVIPVGRNSPLQLQTIVKQTTGPLVIDVCPCSFVPLIGAAGWEDSPVDEAE